jgi:hypothetical protein
VVLVGGLVLANYGGGITPAEAHHRYYQNPFKQILSKLDAILKILNSPNTGGGSTPSPSPGGGAGYQSPSWDTHNQSAALRFTVLADFGSAAVKDSDTGLVWEKLPSTMDTWLSAREGCLKKPVGGTKGWRLPSIPELASLIDPSVAFPGPTLTQGHPFSTVVGANYWSTTTSASSTSAFGTGNILVVNFQEGSVETIAKSSTAQAWCVRGPMTESLY